MHFVVNQNHRPEAYSAVLSIADAAGGRLVGAQGYGFLRIAVADRDSEAVESLLAAEGLPFTRQENGLPECRPFMSQHDKAVA